MNDPFRRLDFRVGPHDDPRLNGRRFVEPVIDGVPLSDLAQAFQLATYAHHSGYGGIDLLAITPASEHFLGIDTQVRDDERVQLLGCHCGVATCWPLRCHIEVGEHAIVWRDFANPHRGPGAAGGYWPFTGFGPFRFHPRQYRHALELLDAM